MPDTYNIRKVTDMQANVNGSDTDLLTVGNQGTSVLRKFSLSNLFNYIKNKFAAQDKSTFKAIELTPTSSQTHGGYIDFHYAGSSEDYTSRIIEKAAGQCQMRAQAGLSAYFTCSTNTHSAGISLYAMPNGNHGIYSSGYFDGTTYTATGITMMFRNTSGQVLVANSDGTQRMPIGTNATDGARIARIFCNSSTQIGVVGQWGTAGADYTTKYINIATSDPRLKENIDDSDLDALALINQIRMHKFDWTADDNHWDVGFIAPELFEIDENLAIQPGDEDSYWGVNDFYLLGVNTKAIQELSEKVDRIEQKLDSILGENQNEHI